MGGGSKETTTVYRQKPAQPILYRKFIPKESYEDVRDYVKRIDADTAALQKDRYTEVGTPAEIRARDERRRTQEAATYLASSPGSFKDPGLLEVKEDASGKPIASPGLAAPTNTQQAAVAVGSSNLVKQAEALKKAEAAKAAKPESTVDPSKYDPSYAKRDWEQFMNV